VLKGAQLRVMYPDGTGKVVADFPALQLGVRLRTAVQGPDGNLYITTDVGGGGGEIWRITPS
jgi:glucose/arabinose dehydrogenase